MNDCIFCKIVRGEAPSYTVWEDEKHLAFLSIFPNTPGVVVVVPKAHQPSYIFAVPDEVLMGIMFAAKTVATRIDQALPDVGRTGVVFEGFGVDHLHVKLFPLHGTKSETWQPRKSNVDKFFDQYEGYISSHDHKRASDADLQEMAEKIRGTG